MDKKNKKTTFFKPMVLQSLSSYADKHLYYDTNS